MSLDISPLRVSIPLGSVDASGPEDRPVLYVSKAIRVLGVYLIDSTAKTGHADNKGTYEVINKGTAGAGTAVVATRTTDTPTTDDIAAFDAWPLTLNADETVLEIAAGSVLSFTAAEAGTATSGDLVEACLVIEYADGYGGGI